MLALVDIQDENIDAFWRCDSDADDMVLMLLMLMIMMLKLLT